MARSTPRADSVGGVVSLISSLVSFVYEKNSTPVFSAYFYASNSFCSSIYASHALTLYCRFFISPSCSAWEASQCAS